MPADYIILEERQRKFNRQPERQCQAILLLDAFCLKITVGIQFLDEIAEEYRARIFAIELGYADELKFVEEYYGINQSPSMIIDYETVLSGYSDKEKIARVLE